MAESLFALSDEIVVDQLKLNAKKRETQQQRNQHICVVESLGKMGTCKRKKFNPKLEIYEHKDLDKKLQMF